MPTQRRNRQRKNRRNSQRRNRKNLQRGGISLLGFNFLESPEEKGKREAEEKEKREAEEKRKINDADLLAINKSSKATKLLGTDDSDTSSKIGAPVQTGNTEPVDHSNINFEPDAGNEKEDEVRKIFGGKQKKSNKKNKKSNKKR